MAEPAKTDPPADPGPEDQEKAYWDKFGAEFDNRLNAWFDKKREEFRGPSTSRSGGRTTLPGILADLIFGPEKKQ